MKKSLLTMLLSIMVLLPSAAQQRSEAEAQAIAKAFMQNNGYDFNSTKSAKIQKVRAEKAGEIIPYYIFNDTQNGGFVIVGGQEGMSDILAYSDEECFNVDDTPPSAAAWLDYYAAVAKKAADYPEESKAEKKAAAKAFVNSNFAVRKNVNPLLGQIKFNQGHPYNDQYPILTTKTIKDGKETVKTDNGLVGCSSTAFGMIMRYWKHPERPNGYKEYTFSYDSIVNKDSLNAKGEATKISGKMTLVGDFDNAGTYDWDNMLPTYKSGTEYNEVQAAAVSKLLAHVSF
ncbi:MAG: Spi family protease inhibitor [Alphaproteobacteria bacterium]|nr:Spi family protease inhibitor [Alphaproteobacteria bacterium]